VDLICVTCETKVSVSEVAATRHKRCHVCGDPLVPLAAAQPQSAAAPAAGIAPVALPPPPKPRQQIAPAAAPAPPRAPAMPAAPSVNFVEEYERVVSYAIAPGPYVHLRRSGIPREPLHASLSSFGRSVPPEQVIFLVSVAIMGRSQGFLLTPEFCHFHVAGLEAGEGGHFWMRDVIGAAPKDRGEIYVHLTYGHQQLAHPPDPALGQSLLQAFDQFAAVNRCQPPPPTEFGPVAPLLARQFPPPQNLMGMPGYFHLRQRGFDPRVFFYLLQHAPAGIGPRDVLAIYHDQQPIPHSQVILFTSRGLAVCFGDGRRFPIPYGQLAGAALTADPQAAAIEIIHKNGARLPVRCGAEMGLKYQFVHMLCEIGRLNLPADRLIEPG
jgi:hypothetical protein